MTTLFVSKFIEDPELQVELKLFAGKAGLDRQITAPRIQKPGLALAGFLDLVSTSRVQVFGKTEMAYLASIGEVAKERAAAFFAKGVACVVITANITPPEYLCQIAEQFQTPLLSTPLSTSLCIERISSFLRGTLAEKTSTHGVLVDVNGIGILLLGKSGIGKSECALDLIIRGYRLVADDLVEIAKINDGIIVGRAPMLTKHLIEVRGLGIINIKDIFGISSVREEKRIEMVAELVDWNQDEEYDRLGLIEERYTFLGVSVPYHRLPVRPGRNMTSILEIAARNHLLKLQGHHSAQEFQRKLEFERLTPTPFKPFRGKAE
jgi:HPr kinase/phosphorylase